MGVLSQILDNKRGEIKALRRRSFPASHQPRKLALSRQSAGKLHLLTEIKFRSPSAGPLSTQLDVAGRARCYEENGASMLSILCDERFFDGSYEHLTQARNACSLPLLCKEFVLDEVQLDAAVSFGADAVLLIVRCLDDHQLRRLVAGAESRGLAALVEVHGPNESQRALDAGATLIGVNARDLDTLEMNVVQARSVLAALPEHVRALHLSGIKTPADILEQRKTRADAALIGETLMRQDDPSSLLRALADAARDD